VLTEARKTAVKIKAEFNIINLYHVFLYNSEISPSDAWLRNRKDI